MHKQTRKKRGVHEAVIAAGRRAFVYNKLQKTTTYFKNYLRTRH